MGGVRLSLPPPWWRALSEGAFFCLHIQSIMWEFFFRDDGETETMKKECKKSCRRLRGGLNWGGEARETCEERARSAVQPTWPGRFSVAPARTGITRLCTRPRRACCCSGRPVRYGRGGGATPLPLAPPLPNPLGWDGMSLESKHSLGWDGMSLESKHMCKNKPESSSNNNVPKSR